MDNTAIEPSDRGRKGHLVRATRAWDIGTERELIRMCIVVCVKQVPATHDVRIDPETKRLCREGAGATMNPFDTHALEEALQLRNRGYGPVVALSMGPAQAETTVRKAMACGADSGILLCDRAFAGSDTWATSLALACAIRKIGRVRLVLCGKQAVDGDTAQVGPGIAAHLDWPAACGVRRLAPDGDGWLADRMLEWGTDRIRVDTPAVVTVLKDMNTPRLPTLRGYVAARTATLTIWTAADIGLDAAAIGLAGSPTRVVSTMPPPAREGGTRVIRGTPAHIAAEAVRHLRRRALG